MIARPLDRRRAPAPLHLSVALLALACVSPAATAEPPPAPAPVATTQPAAATGRALQPASASERAVFVLVQARTDTFAVERMSRTDAMVTSDFLDRTRGIRIRYELDLAPNATTPGLRTTVTRATGDTIPVQAAAFVRQGDTVHVRFRVPANAPAQRLTGTPDAIFYINPSPAMFEQVLRRARALGGTNVRVPLLNVQGGGSSDATVTWIGADSATISAGGIVMRARTDAAGRLLGASVPVQQLTITRVAELAESASPSAATAAKRADYSAPPDAPYTARDIDLRTTGNIVLEGTLTLPKTASASRRVPAVVLITGSGQQTRDEELPGLPGYRPFRQIADTLSRRGIAVLRLDDRGAGYSGRGPTQPTTQDFADDVRAALTWLRTQPQIDGSRLALVGHSEGGIIAPMIAQDDTTVRAIALLAGPAWTIRRILTEQQRWAVEHDESIRAEKRDSALAAFRARTDSAITAVPWLRWLADYDPVTTARKVRTPVLILQGATDRQVNPAQAEELGAAFRAGGNRDVTVRVFPNLNHLFLVDPHGGPERYPSLPSRTVGGEVLGTLADWVVSRLR